MANRRKRWRNDFSTPAQNESWYDLFEDWDLIEASFAQQYGIRLRREAMCWNEFCTLLSGLNHETPFGSIVSIRAEKDAARLKNFTPEQNRIRREYLNRRALETVKDRPELARKQTQEFQQAMKAAFSRK